MINSLFHVWENYGRAKETLRMEEHMDERNPLAKLPPLTSRELAMTGFLIAVHLPHQLSYPF